MKILATFAGVLLLLVIFDSFTTALIVGCAIGVGAWMVNNADKKQDKRNR